MISFSFMIQEKNNFSNSQGNTNLQIHHLLHLPRGIYFYQLLGWPKANLEPLTREQPRSTYSIALFDPNVIGKLGTRLSP